MTSRPEFSAQTLSVLAALCDQPSQWQHGYALAKQTGLRSGTLYPILIWGCPVTKESRSASRRYQGTRCGGSAAAQNLPLPRSGWIRRSW